jgi:hypothetical protein
MIKQGAMDQGAMDQGAMDWHDQQVQSRQDEGIGII